MAKTDQERIESEITEMLVRASGLRLPGTPTGRAEILGAQRAWVEETVSYLTRHKDDLSLASGLLMIAYSFAHYVQRADAWPEPNRFFALLPKWTA